MNRVLKLSALSLILMLAACVSNEIHQGNVMKNEKIWSVQKGDTKFRVESLLGTPALVDPLYPNRVQYVEDLRHSDKGPDMQRTIEITYDDALRVTNIEYYGFDKGAKK